MSDPMTDAVASLMRETADAIAIASRVRGFPPFSDHLTLTFDLAFYKGALGHKELTEGLCEVICDRLPELRAEVQSRLDKRRDELLARLERLLAPSSNIPDEKKDNPISATE